MHFLVTHQSISVDGSSAGHVVIKFSSIDYFVQTICLAVLISSRG